MGRRYSSVGLSRRDGSRWSGRRGFLPTQLASLSLWLRSDMGITTDTGGVSAWADQSGKANDASQATSGVRPDFTASDANFNGFPSVNFVRGTADFLQIAHHASVSLTAGYTVYVVMNMPTAVAGEYFIIGTWGTATSAQEWLIQPRTGAGWGAMLVRSAALGSVAIAGSPATLLDTGSTLVARGTFRADDTTAAIRVDGGTELTDTVTSHNVSASQVLALGHAVGALTATYDCAEVIIVQREVTATEDTAIMAYLDTRYGL